MNALKKLQSKPAYGTVIVIISTLMVMTVLGFCSSSKSIYLTPVCEALGISRGAFSINDSCRFITSSIINIFFGALIAKFGAKKLILAGFTSLIASTLVYSVSTNVWGFYAGGVLLGIGFSWTTTTMVGSVVNNWCPKNKGTIMGIILASNGVGAAIAVQILSPIINNPSNPFGYRNAYRLVALILAAVALIMLLLFKNKPDKRLNHTVDEKKTDDTIYEGPDYSDIIKKPYFYLAAVCIFFTGMVLQSITGISAPLYKDVGIDSAFIATLLSIHSLMLTVSKFSTGFSYDRFGINKTSGLCFISAAVSMLLLLNVSPSGMGRTAALAYSVFSTFALPLETIMLPIYARELFGENSFNKVLGILRRLILRAMQSEHPLPICAST